MPRPVITGLGVVCCLGSGTEDFWLGLHSTPPAPREVADPGARFDIRHYHLADAGPAASAGPGPASRMAVRAARQAVADSGLDGAEASRVAVVLGTAMGDYPLFEQRPEHEPAETGPFTEYLVASAVADAVGFRGPVTTVANACAASGYALAVAADMIRCGEADAVVVGGADSYSRVAMANFNRMGAVDPVRCRPFDLDRQGTVFGEAAAVLVLESVEHAARRGAGHVYAELAGTGWSCDAHHPTAPEPSGTQIVEAMRRSLRDAEIGPESVGCVIPHGTGTRLNDQVESKALGEVFGGGEPLPMFSLKAVVGHTAGAAGTMAALTAALMLDRGEVPPTLAPLTPDPECEVRLEPSASPLGGDYVMANAYAFGGNNVSVLLGRVSS